jgi:hypothetical protein
LLVLLPSLPLYAQKASEDSKDVTATVQRLFDAIAARDSSSALAFFIPVASGIWTVSHGSWRRVS